jgi:hypothetical protein
MHCLLKMLLAKQSHDNFFKLEFDDDPNVGVNL